MSAPIHPPPQSRSTPLQEDREQRLQLIIRKGLPPFRQTALELTKALGGESPDMKKAGKLISADPRSAPRCCECATRRCSGCTAA